MTLNRRQFVRETARAALAAGSFGALRSPAAAAVPSLPIVDTHQHLWDLAKLRLPWLRPGEPLTRNYVTRDYLEATRGLNLAQAVYMEVDVEPSQQPTEAAEIVELCQRRDNPTCAAVIGGEPHAPGFRDYICRFRGSPYVKGVRHIPREGELREGLWERKEFLEGIRLLGDLGMSFDLCLPPDQLAAAAKLVDQCPLTRFIVDHCGNADPKAFRRRSRRADPPRHDPDQWRRGLGELAQRKLVVCKISGIVASAPEKWSADDLAPIINHCISVFGPERVMFASDWPVCTRRATLRGWVEALGQVVADRDPDFRRKLFHDNAMHFYGLSAKAWVRGSGGDRKADKRSAITPYNMYDYTAAPPR
jgi:predicted TIM-barrel fold metal-dependent hydrolase